MQASALIVTQWPTEAEEKHRRLREDAAREHWLSLPKDQRFNIQELRRLPPPYGSCAHRENWQKDCKCSPEQARDMNVPCSKCARWTPKPSYTYNQSTAVCDDCDLHYDRRCGGCRYYVTIKGKKPSDAIMAADTQWRCHKCKPVVQKIEQVTNIQDQQDKRFVFDRSVADEEWLRAVDQLVL